MSDLSQSIISVFAELSWKRLRGLLLLLALAVIVLLAFEWYTSSFSLTRIQKASEALQSVHNLEISGASKNPQIKEAYETLLIQTNSTIAKEPFSLSLSLPKFNRHSLTKFLRAFWPWILLFLLYRNNQDSNMTFGMTFMVLLMGSISGFIGLLQPDHYWWNCVFYPLIFFVVAALLVAGFGVYMTQRTASRLAARSPTVSQETD